SSFMQQCKPGAMALIAKKEPGQEIVCQDGVFSQVARLQPGYLNEYIPAAVRRVESVEGATHFSFMQQCKPGAMALIAEKEPGQEIVCQDGGTRNRAAIHRQLTRDISAFLNQSLGFQPLSGGNPSGLYR
ncbi:hypothetical protein ACQPT2_22435, partial [Erwinia amylovora]